MRNRWSWSVVGGGGGDLHGVRSCASSPFIISRVLARPLGASRIRGSFSRVQERQMAVGFVAFCILARDHDLSASR